MAVWGVIFKELEGSHTARELGIIFQGVAHAASPLVVDLLFFLCFVVGVSDFLCVCWLLIFGC